jgi:Cof subfamily protein (haloacid dehalogenase superfamily)
VRLIATDLDGTILRPDGTISEATREAFRAAREAGVVVLPVTGRPTRWLDVIREGLGGLGTVICSNGAVVYDDSTSRVLESTVLDVDVLQEAQDAIRFLAPDAVFAAETVTGLHLEPGFAPGAAEREGVAERVFDARRLADEGVVKFLAKRASGSSSSFHDLVAPTLSPLLSLTRSAPRVPLLEMAALGVDKAVTLARHVESLGLDRADVVAFGDMPNDIGMLTWAGTGYAVGRDQPLVAAAADQVIGPVGEDSVAEMVRHLLAETARGTSTSPATDGGRARQ